MDHHPTGSPTPSHATLESRQVTRRALLQALGFGGAALSIRPASAAAQATPASAAAPDDKRAPGGPDLDQLVWDLQFDPEKLFRFVADQVAYEAYSGVLRGAKGAHWSLAGNSVDQALLLAAMLTKAQIPVRFAAGQIDEMSVTKLRAAMDIDEAGAREQAGRVGAGARMRLDRYPGLTPEQRAALQSPDELRQRLLERARNQLEDGLSTVQAGLAAGSISLPSPEPEPDLPDRERRQHVWVQYADGPQWVDLDPSIPDAEPGKAYARQAETWEAIPDELHHRVRFRAVVETNTSGVATRADAFVHESRAADLVGVPVVFAHVDPNALKKMGVSINGLIEGSQQYTPSLLAGTAGEIGDPVTLHAGGGAAAALGGSGTDGEAIGEWLEIDILPLDGPEMHTVREVFDRVGTDRRAAGTIDLASLPPVEFITDPQLGTVFLPLETVWLIGVVGGRIPGAYFDQDYAIKDVEADMSLLVHGYHAARDGLQLEIASAQGYRWFHDQPNLTAAVLAPAASASGAYVLSASLDLLHQHYGVLPLRGASPSVPPRVLAGVLAHVAERLGAEAGAELTPATPPPPGSVAQVFEAAKRTGLQIRTLTPATSDVSALGVSDVAKARINEALAAGYVVIVPERAVRLGESDQIGWWQVDPTTGRTFDLMENGRGGSPMGEDTVIIVGGPAWRAATAWKVLSFAIGIIVGFSATMAIIMYPN